jgi:DNA-3-methyladenine glycosylase I
LSLWREETTIESRQRENYRRVLDGFDPTLITRDEEAKFAALLADPGIVRNRAKVAAIHNAMAFLMLTADGQSFSAFLWQFIEVPRSGTTGRR